MTPKEKAKELVDKFYDLAYVAWHGGENEFSQPEAAKEIAIIAVDEILNAIQDIEVENVNWNFWNNVKEEINRL